MGLGSNLGDPKANLARALTRLGEISGILSVTGSPVYLTEPQLVREQPWFANQVARVVCAVDVLPPLALLEALLRLELELGRDRGGRGVPPPKRFGPRAMDLDLLLYGDEVLDGERLTLPHPRLRERAFVLLPLADLAPDLPLPGGGTPAGLLDGLSYRREGDKIWQE
ncbi:2-amino-4-hydroxy-6-hydroxymethyldihydropteridine diphosphokinase [Desulfocurvus sp. DL9XJH121]